MIGEARTLAGGVGSREDAGAEVETPRRVFCLNTMGEASFVMVDPIPECVAVVVEPITEPALLRRADGEATTEADDDDDEEQIDRAAPLPSRRANVGDIIFIIVLYVCKK